MSALFTSLATKLSLAESIPGGGTNEESLAANYGRAAFHALVECSPGINPSPDGGMSNGDDSLDMLLRLIAVH